ncbi:MAG: hypothetical protein EOO10_13635 [Chitinophagaceae bacterium]|nr:MAG: hypothetical protein EOO10_13635 [Chitinophagaceae bacterium]
MRIAFTSYEYPGETGGGGIGTYLQIVSKLLHEQGHSVVVFTATSEKSPFWENGWVYRIPATNWQSFNDLLPSYFLPIHCSKPFDVLEATDFQACGLSIKKALPFLPLVVRLHTPLYMVDRLMYKPLPWRSKLRFAFGALRKVQLPSFPSGPNRADYKREFDIINAAEVVSSPSQSIADEMMRLGFPLNGKTEFVPLPFESEIASRSIMNHQALSNSPLIVFIGRMEIRKGVIELAKSVPSILKKYPKARFVFVGASSLSPRSGVDMISYLQEMLKRYITSITFTNRVGREEVF